MKLAGRVALVTGGARRIGNAIALALAERQVHVAVSYRSSVREARDTVEAIEAFGVRALAVKTDLSRSTEITRLITRVGRRFGRLDILINCAATFDRTPFRSLSEAHWDHAMKTNLKGPFLCALQASRLMRRRGGGKIINFADWAGVRPYRHYLPYCVSKAGLIGLTKALALELAPTIHVNAIAPGPILPPLNINRLVRAKVAARVPLRRWGSPKDVVNAVLFLLEGTDYMTGATIFVDGGSLISEENP